MIHAVKNLPATTYPDRLRPARTCLSLPDLDSLAPTSQNATGLIAPRLDRRAVYFLTLRCLDCPTMPDPAGPRPDSTHRTQPNPDSLTEPSHSETQRDRPLLASPYQDSLTMTRPDAPARASPGQPRRSTTHLTAPDQT